MPTWEDSYLDGRIILKEKYAVKVLTAMDCTSTTDECCERCDKPSDHIKGENFLTSHASGSV
jgi:hypothetical protein